MVEYRIRHATEADVGALQRYASELFAEDLPGVFRRPAPTLDEEREFVRVHTDPANSTMLLAVAAGEIVGLIALRGESLPERAHAGEFGLSVRHGWRGRGIGTALLEALFAWAPQHGITRIEGEAFASNPRALALYERMGFAIEGRRVGAVIRDGMPVDLIPMAKVFEPADGRVHGSSHTA